MYISIYMYSINSIYLLSVLIAIKMASLSQLYCKIFEDITNCQKTRAFKRPRIQDARLNDDVSRLNDDDVCAGPRIQDFHRLHLRVARSLRSLANKAKS